MGAPACRGQGGSGDVTGADPGRLGSSVAVVDVLALFQGRHPLPLPPLEPAPQGLVVVGFREDTEALNAAFDAGIPFYILEALKPGALAEMARHPGPEGDAYGALARRCAERMARLAAGGWPPAGLTRREEEVLWLAAGECLANREIGRRLGIKEKTVRQHLSHAYDKAGLRDRYEAIARFRAWFS